MNNRMTAILLAVVMTMTVAAPIFAFSTEGGVSASSSAELTDFRLEVNQKVNVREYLEGSEPEGAYYRIDKLVGDAVFIDADNGQGTYTCDPALQEPVMLGTKTTRLTSASEEGRVYLRLMVYAQPRDTEVTSCTVTIYDPSQKITDTFYFFIKIVDDFGLKNAQLSGISQSDIRDGFWVAGTGSTAALALKEICSREGWHLQYDEKYYKGWIDTFLGLGTYPQTGGDYLYWVQYCWDGSQWVFNDLCLGYLTSVQYKFVGLMFMRSTMEGMESGIDAGSSGVPEGIRFQQDINAGIWNTPAESVTLDRVPSEKYLSEKYCFDRHSVTVGGKFQLNACVLPHTATDRSVVWTSSDENVAKVDGKGYVTTIKSGEAVITATSSDGGFTAECMVTVLDQTKVTGVELNKYSLEISEGESQLIFATVIPDTAKNNKTSWISSDRGIVLEKNNYDNSCEVTGISEGVAKITVMPIGGTCKAVCEVTVIPAVLVKGISMNRTEASMETGSSLPLYCDFSPANATNKNLTWTSSDDTVAGVSDTGRVTALAAGTAVIRAIAADGGYETVCTVTVTAGSSQAPDDGGNGALIIGGVAAAGAVIAIAAYVLMRRR